MRAGITVDSSLWAQPWPSLASGAIIMKPTSRMANHAPTASFAATRSFVATCGTTSAASRSCFSDCTQRGFIMKSIAKALVALPLLSLLGGLAYANGYSDTIARFRDANQSANFFRNCYGYAVFPTVGEGAIGIGGAFGKGRVYLHGHYVGDVSMGEISVGFQAGGKGFSQVIFFEDKRALGEFESSGFEFGADVSAVAITAGASATASTNGASAGASVDVNSAVTRGAYQKGMAVFTIAKGGLMYQAAVAGQKFHYTPRSS
jgi:hypothetical protein